MHVPPTNPKTLNSVSSESFVDRVNLVAASRANGEECHASNCQDYGPGNQHPLYCRLGAIPCIRIVDSNVGRLNRREDRMASEGTFALDPNVVSPAAIRSLKKQ